MLSDLKDFFSSDDILTEKTDLLAYSYDNSRLKFMPDYVVFATSAEQIQNTVHLCAQTQTPLNVRGRGSATTGASLAREGGIVMSLERMRNIIKIDSDNRYAVVEPGVTNQELQQACYKYGLFWGPNPSSAAFCTIGGNLACNAAGPNSVKYGATRDNVLALEFVDGTGELIRTGKPVSKLAVGYDLTRLLIGSEGTLGIINKATLKLSPLAETSRTVRILYANIEAAAASVVKLMQLNNVPGSIEFLDQYAFALVKNDIEDLKNYKTATMLLLKVDSSFDNIDSDIEKVAASSFDQHRLDFSIALDDDAEKNLWLARKLLSPKLKEIAPKKINEDVVVPIANIPELLNGLDRLRSQYNINIVNFGHAGNGNIHVNLLINPDDRSQVKSAQICLEEIFSLVIGLDGAISGEHGIGIAKQDFLHLELEPATRELMTRLKSAFDPNNILNPGKGFAHI